MGLGLGSLFSGMGGAARGAVMPFGLGGGRPPQRGASVMGQQGGWVPPDDPNAVHDQMQSAQQPQGNTLGDLYQPSPGGGSYSGGFAQQYNPNPTPTPMPQTSGDVAGAGGGGPVEAPEDTPGAVEQQQKAAQAQLPPSLPMQQQQGHPDWRDAVVYAKNPGAPGPGMEQPPQPQPPQSPQFDPNMGAQARPPIDRQRMAMGMAAGTMGRMMNRPQPPMARMQRGGTLGDLMQQRRY